MADVPLLAAQVRRVSIRERSVMNDALYSFVELGVGFAAITEARSGIMAEFVSG